MRTSKLVAPVALQVSVADVFVPVAPFAGLGEPGAAGGCGWAATAVVNDHVTLPAIRLPATSVTAAFTVAVYVLAFASAAVGVSVTVRVAAL
jgi:hypothetical protein